MNHNNAVRYLEKGLRALRLVRDHRMKTSYNIHKRIYEFEQAIKALQGGKSRGAHAGIQRAQFKRKSEDLKQADIPLHEAGIRRSTKSERKIT